MVSRALLLGSQCFGLTGVGADVAFMETILDERGFCIESRVGDNVTRRVMLEALEDLAAASRPGDAVVIYYSGHGGRDLLPDWEDRRAAGKPVYAQYLVPCDIDASTEATFLGVLAEELSRFQRRLTEVTPNVTTILDCCHSGSMARDLRIVPKSVERDLPLSGILARLEQLPPAAGGATDTNPDAVRLVACAPEESAFEGPLLGGSGRGGFLTSALVSALRALGNRDLPWSVVIDHLRRQIGSVTSLQRPEVEGPSSRRPFSLDRPVRPQGFPVAAKGGRPCIEAAALLGLHVGDRVRFDLPELSHDRPGIGVGDGDEGVADVLSIDDGDAILDAPASVAGVTAFPVRLSAPRYPVGVGAVGPVGDRLRAAITASPRLVVANDDGGLSVHGGSDGLAVVDGLGAPLRSGTQSCDDAGVAATVALLELAAAAWRLRTLDSGGLSEPVEVSLLVDQGGAGAVAATRQGTRLYLGDRLQVRIQNQSTRPLFVWLFDIGVSQRISLITQGDPSGARIAAAGDEGDTKTVWGGQPAPANWPADVPSDGPREETFAVIVADRRQDLSGLARGDRGARSTSPRVPGLLAEAAYGSREVSSEGDARGFRYRIEHIDVLLVPHARVGRGTPNYPMELA